MKAKARSASGGLVGSICDADVGQQSAFTAKLNFSALENEGNWICYLDEIEIGKTYYCNSETPFYWVSFWKYAITLAPDSRDVSSKTLENINSIIGAAKGAELVSLKP